MKITVFNSKGGVGKSSISLNMHLSFGYNLVTNDTAGMLADLCEDRHLLTLHNRQSIPEFKKNLQVIFDLGGFMDKRIQDCFMQSEVIMIPVTADKEFLRKHLDLLEELRELKLPAEIIIICNKTNNDNFQLLTNLFQYHFPEIKTFQIRRSSAISRMWMTGKSIQTLTAEFPQFKRFFQPVHKNFSALENYLRKKYD